MNDITGLLTHKDICFSQCSNSITVNNPASGELIAYVKKTSAKQLEKIIQKAQDAQKLWAKKSALERADILWNWYYLIKQNKMILARLMTMEQGKCLSESEGEIDYAASFIRWFAEEIRRTDGQIITSVKDGQKILVIKQPIGVTAAITPWNFPAAMITRKAAPAIGVGCAMIVKPASLTPLSAYAQANLAYKAGIPQDLFAIVGGNAAEICDIFTKNQIIRKISFTGSTEVGREIYAKSADGIKKLSLELGGNAPVIVFDDANLIKAVDGVMASKFRNSGQTCVCANRIYVQSKIYDEFCEKISQKVVNLKLGNGLKNCVEQGPLIDKRAVEKVQEHINDALNKGAKCLVGGKASALGRTFFEPTILGGATDDMLVFKEETFGPLCPLFKFDDEDEVIKRANDTEFGLASYIFTENPARQWRVSEALEYGMVGVNTGLISNEAAPFGGVKASGFGKEGSKFGVDEYLQMKYICLDINEK